MKNLCILSFMLLGTLLAKPNGLGNDILIDGLYYSIDIESGIATVSGGEYTNGIIPDIINVANQITVDNKTYPVTKIGGEAFCWVNDGQKIALPNTITTIGSTAFGTHVIITELPESIEYLYDLCLNEATVPDEVNLPKLKDIGPFGLATSNKIKKLTIGSDLYAIGEQAFGSTENIVLEDGNPVLPLRTPFISSNSFRKTNAQELRLPNKIGLTLGDHIFAESEMLERVVFPDLDEIYYDPTCHYSCWTSIKPTHSCLIYNCPRLTEIVCLNDNPPYFYIDEQFFDGTLYGQTTTVFSIIDNMDQCVLKVPAGSEELYRADPVWGMFKTILGFENGDYTAIETVPVAENTTNKIPVYYNLQGIPVSTPVDGQLYIRKTANKAEKILYCE